MADKYRSTPQHLIILIENLQLLHTPLILPCYYVKHIARKPTVYNSHYSCFLSPMYKRVHTQVHACMHEHTLYTSTKLSYTLYICTHTSLYPHTSANTHNVSPPPHNHTHIPAPSCLSSPCTHAHINNVPPHACMSKLCTVCACTCLYMGDRKQLRRRDNTDKQLTTGKQENFVLQIASYLCGSGANYMP